jgi:hypothetical protein
MTETALGPKDGVKPVPIRLVANILLAAITADTDIAEILSAERERKGLAELT